jgi:hypothetical protein
MLESKGREAGEEAQAGVSVTLMQAVPILEFEKINNLR